MVFVVTYLAASGVAVYHAVKEDQPVYWVSTITALPYLGPILFFLFKKDMEKQYGKEKGEQIYFAKIRKMAMEEVEDIEEDMFSRKLMSYKRPDKYMAKQKRKLRKRTV